MIITKTQMTMIKIILYWVTNQSIPAHAKTFLFWLLVLNCLVWTTRFWFLPNLAFAIFFDNFCCTYLTPFAKAENVSRAVWKTSWMIRPSGKIGQNLLLDIHMIALIRHNRPLSFAQWQNPMRIWESKSQCNSNLKLNTLQELSVINFRRLSYQYHVQMWVGKSYSSYSVPCGQRHDLLVPLGDNASP